MIHAYDEIYLERARFVMANMFDYAVHVLGCELKGFFENFLVSDLCARFERGEASVIAGKSGIEITYEVLGINKYEGAKEDIYFIEHRSSEYWLGWALAYYQWHSSMSFSEISQCITIDDMLNMYQPYHEMDIRKFVDKMEEICHETRMITRLKRYRTLAGLSQRELAEKADVPVRTIQQYEQRQKNINKAQAEYLISLSKVLFCQPRDLLER